jgi:hypothetical protein
MTPRLTHLAPAVDTFLDAALGARVAQVAAERSPSPRSAELCRLAIEAAQAAAAELAPAALADLEHALGLVSP